MAKGPFLSREDFKTCFNLFCCIYGIGTLGMPGNFARAGPTLACFALAFMAFANTYSSITMSKVMLLAPRSVNTFGDLGEWSMGKTGRYLCVLSQMGSCLLVPCVFLILGGQLLDGGSGAAFAGCFGTILADIIGVSVVMYGMRGHPSVPFPELKFEQVANMFGNLSLAYGAGIIIPDLQRQHSDPSRMPRIVGITVIFVSCLFLILSSTTYSAIGCQISGNLLFTIYPDSATGMTSLGFKPRWGVVIMAYLFMQLHIIIAFSVILNPAFYIAERLLLGMHKKTDLEIENVVGFEESATPAELLSKQSDPCNVSVNRPPRRSSKISFVSLADSERVHKDDKEADAAEYTGSNVFKYAALRIIIVVILVMVAIVFKDHFSDFIGAFCITTNCILLPIVFYFKKAWERVSMYEKAAGSIVLFVCLVLGCYVTYTTGKELFFPTDNGADFPFCDSEYENKVYYNYTAVHES
ncbi:Transmembrane amino acid transporter protein [Phytophthora infestans]|uniref:Transmembrane amino acid transporter protein n=1 Tax=Phytophthora infestans TaxID=4787 RepID=A0A8S9TTU8_PHYIN|nr:Transmembrane amino acid transporter protein [Phytophthora infestans]